MEQMGKLERNRVVDQYGQKLLNRGYSLDQTKTILVNGIKGMENKKRRCKEEGRSFFRKAKDSMSLTDALYHGSSYWRRTPSKSWNKQKRRS